MAEDTQKLQLTKEAWLREELAEIYPDLAIPGYWPNLEESCKQWAREISVSPFWNRVRDEIKTWRAEYRSKYGGALLAEVDGLPEFNGKKLKRIYEKLYYKRLEDTGFTGKAFTKTPPTIPKLNDLVRTRVVCQYIDGVDFLGDKLFQLAGEMNCNPSRNKEGRVEGYFAQHLNFDTDVVYRFGGGAQVTKIIVEIQIATGLSTAVWETTHSIYESSRNKKRAPNEWQWNPQDPEFIANQLGHMIHLADGLLVQLRNATNLNIGKELKS